MGWIVLGFLSLGLAPATLSGLVPLLLYIVAIALSVLGLAGLHALQRGSYRGVGRAGFYTIVASSGGIVVASVGHLLGSAALDWLMYPVGVLGMVVGFSLYGAATVQAGVMPRWYGVVLIIFLPVSVLLEAYANVWVGVVELALGLVLWTRRGVLLAQQRGLRTEP